MPSEAALTAIETAIRNAIVTDSFAEANVLLGRYVAAAEELLRSLPPGSEAVRALQVRTHDLFGWTKVMTLAAREYAAAELDRLQSVSRYHHPRISFPRFRANA
jgi:hypothetical protein